MKYELTNDTITINGMILYRIKALKDFSDVKKGDLGGYVWRDDNLDHKGNCWIYNRAKVYSCGWVSDNAVVCDNAEVYGDAWIHDNAKIYGDAKIYQDARIGSRNLIGGDAKIGST